MAAMVDTISASELKQTLDQFIVIDVREQDELANGTIDGSTHMPLGLATVSYTHLTLPTNREV